MALTVAEALELSVLRQADAEVVAGVRGLAAEIRWVHISEQPDIARYLKGGELLFTTGMGLGHNSDLQRRYVRSLADVPIAALLLRLGGTYREVPTTLSKEAEERGLPLIVLRRRIGAVELTEQIHGALIGRHHELVEAAEQMGQTLVDLVVDGADLHLLLRHLAEALHNPVVLEDSAHEIVAFATASLSTAEVLDAWKLHARHGHVESTASRTSLLEGTPGCLWAPIRTKGRRIGRLHVLLLNGWTSELDRLVLDRAVSSVALTLLANADEDHLADRACSALISDILGDRQGQGGEFLRRASACRADLRDHRLVGLVASARGLTRLAAHGDLDEHDRRAVRDLVLRETRRALAEAGCPGVCGLDRDRVLAVVGIKNDRELRAAINAIGERICELVDSKAKDIDLIVGVSDETVVSFLKRALEDASEAAACLSEASPAKRVHHFGDLGLEHLLVQLGNSTELARYVEAELDPLIGYPSARNARLLETLRIYLACGGRKSETARSLGIERRSLYHRLDRIRALLERDLDDPDTRFRLWFALRALDLLKRRALPDPAETALSEGAQPAKMSHSG